MCSEFTINEINISNYNFIISILDYEVILSRILKDLKFTKHKGGKCIVDTMLKSGKNKYRFIELNILNSGCLDIDNIKYVNTNKELEEKANSILLNYKESIKHSVLTERQIDEFLKNKREG